MTYLGPGSTGLEITTASVTIDPALASADPAMMATAARTFASAAHQIQAAGQASSKASTQLSADWSGKGEDGFDAASSKLNARTALGADAMAAAAAALQTLAAQIAPAKTMAQKAQTMAADSSQAATRLQSAYTAASQQAIQALPPDATYEQTLAARAPSAAQVAQADTISADAAQATQLMAQANAMARQAWDQAAVAFRAITATSPTRTAQTSGHAHQTVTVSPDQVRIVTQPDGRRVYSFDGGLAIPLDLPGAHQFVEEIKAYMPRFLAGDHAGLQVPPNLSAQGLWFVAASFWVTTSMQTIPEALRNVFFTARFSSVTMKQLAIMSLPEIVGGAYALSQSEFFKNLFSRQVATSAGNVPLNQPARTDPPTGDTTPTPTTANQVTDAQTVQADQQLGTADTNAGNTDTAGSSVAATGASQEVDNLADTALVTERLQEHVDTAVQKFDSEEIRLSPAQQRAVRRNPNLYAAFRGNVIDARAKYTIERDPELRGLEITKLFKFGPDIYDPATHRWWDITTPGQWPAHVARYNDSFGTGVPLYTRSP